jgi:hypothetical protein
MPVTAEPGALADFQTANSLPGLIFTPHLESKPFANQIGSLNHRCFFLGIFIVAFFDMAILFPQRLASFAPGTAFLPTVKGVASPISPSQW